ncbi:MAG: N-acetyltransferase family protein [Acidimicrobiales bacterium]
MQGPDGPPTRPMETADVAPAVEVWCSAIADMGARHRPPSREAVAGPAGADRDRVGRRIAHLLATDPAGSWVAERDGAVVGLAQAFVRGRHWVLSLLGVDPACQSAGVGRALLGRALGYGAGGPGTIQASVDPRAIRLYATAGFEPHPTLVAAGPVTRRPAGPPSVRAAGEEGLAAASAVDRAVRGAPRLADLAHLVAGGATLLLDGDRAYALAQPDRVVTLAGRDEPSAAAVLTAALARARPDGPFEVGWLTGGQRWALGPLLDAGLPLFPSGPVMIRGMERPFAPYLPSGGFG